MFEVDFLYIVYLFNSYQKDVIVLLRSIFLFQRHATFLMYGTHRHGTSTKRAIFIHLFGKKEIFTYSIFFARHTSPLMVKNSTRLFFIFYS